MGDLVLHAPPINALTILLVPLTFLSSKGPQAEFTEAVCDKFSKFLFWGENIIFVGFFIIQEILLIPFVYVLVFMNIIYSTKGLFTTVFRMLVWILFGHIFFLTFILAYDVWSLLQILAMHRGCLFANNKEVIVDQAQLEKDQTLLELCFNEVRVIVIKMYLDIKKKYNEEKAVGNKPEMDGEEKQDGEPEDGDEKEPDFNSYRTFEVLEMIEKDDEMIQEVGLKRF